MTEGQIDAVEPAVVPPSAEPVLSKDWILWQLADSAFPGGGFGHSGGLEAACKHGAIRGRADLEAFIEAALVQAGQASLPFVAEAFDQRQPFAELDQWCDAFTSNHVANRASRLLGQALLATAAKAFAVPALAGFRQECLTAALPVHFAPAFGAVARLLSLGRMDSLRLFLFGQLRGWISSAVRLGVVGPMEAQSLQARLSATAERVLQDNCHRGLDQACQTAPLLDLFQGAQDRLYSRLFQS